MAGFIVDFYCFECMVVVEVHGHIHNLPHVRRRDLWRAEILEAQGNVVMFVSNANVLTRRKKVCNEILTVCIKRRNRLHEWESAQKAVDENNVPLPLGEGGRGSELVECNRTVGNSPHRGNAYTNPAWTP